MYQEALKFAGKHTIFIIMAPPVYKTFTGKPDIPIKQN